MLVDRHIHSLGWSIQKQMWVGWPGPAGGGRKHPLDPGQYRSSSEATGLGDTGLGTVGGWVPPSVDFSYLLWVQYRKQGVLHWEWQRVRTPASLGVPELCFGFLVAGASFRGIPQEENSGPECW